VRGRDEAREIPVVVIVVSVLEANICLLKMPGSERNARARSLHEVTRHLPRAVFSLRRRDGLDCSGLVFEGAVEADDHVLAVRRARKRGLVRGRLKAPRAQFAERRERSRSQRRPLILAHAALKRSCGSAPAFIVFRGIYQR